MHARATWTDSRWNLRLCSMALTRRTKNDAVWPKMKQCGQKWCSVAITCDGFIKAAKFRMKRYISWGKNVFYWMKRTKIVKRMAKRLLERGMIDTCEKEYDGKRWIVIHSIAVTERFMILQISFNEIWILIPRAGRWREFLRPIPRFRWQLLHQTLQVLFDKRPDHVAFRAGEFLQNPLFPEGEKKSHNSVQQILINSAKKKISAGITDNTPAKEKSAPDTSSAVPWQLPVRHPAIDGETSNQCEIDNWSIIDR